MHAYENPIIKTIDNKQIPLKKKRTQLHFLQWKIVDFMQFRKENTPEKIEIITKNYLHKLKRLNKSLIVWKNDVYFFLKQLDSLNNSDFFKGKIDTNRMGIFGQSFGGAIAGQLCYESKKFKAGINMDCFQFGDIVDNNLGTPFMLIQSEQNPKWNIGNKYIFSKTISPFYTLTLLNSKHFVTSDISIILDEPKYIGNINGNKYIDIINKYLLEFFDIYIKEIKSHELLHSVVNDYIKFDNNLN